MTSENQPSGASKLYDPALPLPGAVDSERCVLSCLMQAPDFAIPAITGMKCEHFVVEAHSLLFEIMLRQFEAGKLVDPVSLTQVLYDRDLMGKVGGPAFVSEIYTASPNPAHVKHYADVVIEKAAQRAAVRAGWALSNGIMVEPEKWQDHCAAAVEAIIAATSGTSKQSEIVHFRVAATEALDAFEKATQNRGHVPDGLCTGFTHLDRVIWGLQPGENCFIAGRPSMGKSSLALNILLNMSLGHGHYQEFYHCKADFETRTNPRQGKVKCLLVCLESSRKKAGIRAVSGLSGVTMQRMRDGFVHKHDWQNLTRTISVIDHGELHVWDVPGCFVEDLEMGITQFKARHPDLAVVCVDHCGKLRARGVSDKAQAYERISYISDRLMTMWLKLGVVGLPVWQLGRDTEKRGNKRPMLSDLRDSGNLEQDASIVIATYRPHYYDKDEPEDQAFLPILKNRDGATNPEGIEVKWDGQTTTFTSTSDKLFSNDETKRQGAEAGLDASSQPRRQETAEETELEL